MILYHHSQKVNGKGGKRRKKKKDKKKPTYTYRVLVRGIKAMSSLVHIYFFLVLKLFSTIVAFRTLILVALTFL